MNRAEIEHVLANWMLQAKSEEGSLDEGTEPAKWVAENFLNWWYPMIEESIGEAELATYRVRQELESLGGWQNSEVGEDMLDVIHVEDALADIRVALGIDGDAMKRPSDS